MTPKQLQKIRTKLGLTQAEFADKVGVHERSWRKWELGERPVPAMAEHLIRIIAINIEKDRREAS